MFEIAHKKIKENIIIAMCLFVKDNVYKVLRKVMYKFEEGAKSIISNYYRKPESHSSCLIISTGCIKQRFFVITLTSKAIIKKVSSNFHRREMQRIYKTYITCTGMRSVMSQVPFNCYHSYFSFSFHKNKRTLVKISLNLLCIVWYRKT